MRWTAVALVAAGLLALGAQLLSSLVERKVASAVGEIGDRMRRAGAQATRAPAGSKLLWRGDSVGAVVAIVRSPAPRDADTLVLIGTLDARLAGVSNLTGFVEGPVRDSQTFVIDLQTRVDAAALRGVATFWPGQAPRPIRVFEAGPGERVERKPPSTATPPGTRQLRDYP